MHADATSGWHSHIGVFFPAPPVHPTQAFGEDRRIAQVARRIWWSRLFHKRSWVRWQRARAGWKLLVIKAIRRSIPYGLGQLLEFGARATFLVQRKNCHFLEARRRQGQTQSDGEESA